MVVAERERGEDWKRLQEMNKRRFNIASVAHLVEPAKSMSNEAAWNCFPVFTVGERNHNPTVVKRDAFFTTAQRPNVNLARQENR